MNMEEVVKEINRADAVLTDILMDAVFARKRQLFPDWEICYIALPKEDREERENTLKMLLELEQKAQKLRMDKK